MNRDSYYEQKSIWNKDYSEDPFWAQKAKIFLSLIPDDVKTILDVGCGNGSMLKKMGNKFNICGLDISKTALEFIKEPAILADSSRIPLKQSSFDLVLCSEVLEHLPCEAFQSSVSEISRVTKKYILLSVPYSENLGFRRIKCSRCKYVFHIYGHLHKFTKRKILSCFKEFMPMIWVHCGVFSRNYNPLLLLFRQHLGDVWFYAKDSHPICPNCGNSEFSPPRYNKIARICNELNVLVKSQTANMPYWVIMLLVRK